MRILAKCLCVALAASLAVPAAAQREPKGYAFIEAVKKGDGNGAMQVLRENPTVINSRDSNGDTALLIAVRNREPDWTAVLLNAGADVNVAGEGGDTALIAAARIGFDDAAHWIVGKNAKIDLANKLGETALIVAIQNRNVELAKILLQEGANPDKSDFSGHSARDYAKRDTRNRQIQTLFDAKKTAR